MSASAAPLKLRRQRYMLLLIFPVCGYGVFDPAVSLFGDFRQQDVCKLSFGLFPGNFTLFSLLSVGAGVVPDALFAASCFSQYPSRF